MIKKSYKVDSISKTEFADCWRLIVNANGSVSSILRGNTENFTCSIRDIYEIPLYAIKRVSEPITDSPLSGLKVSNDLTAEDFQATTEFCDIWQAAQSYPKDKLLVYDNRIYRTTEAHTSQSGRAPDLSDLYEDLME